MVTVTGGIRTVTSRGEYRSRTYIERLHLWNIVSAWVNAPLTQASTNFANSPNVSPVTMVGHSGEGIIVKLWEPPSERLAYIV